MFVFALFLLPAVLLVLALVLTYTGHPREAAIVTRIAAANWLVILGLASWGWLRKKKDVH